MNGKDLSFSTPESVGIPSEAIAKFICKLQEQQLCMHSVLVFRRSQLVSEGYAAPWHVSRKHRMYSISKSFTALGIGLLLDEGKISLDDPIVKFYPEYAPGPVHPFISEATIRDMLTMRDPHDQTLSGLADWFSTPPTHPPGTVFMYNTTCTNLLCGIIEKLSGVTLMEYLYPRLLEPIGFTPDCICIKGHWGYSWSGSGIICTPRDLARVAMVCMNGGRWGDKQLISEAYIKEATGRQTDNSLTSRDAERWAGYGYQIWRTRNNGFAFWGMGSQFAICLPDQDLLLVCTADTQGIDTAESTIIKTFWDTIFASLSDEALSENVAELAKLKELNSNMALTVQPGEHTMPIAHTVSGKTYNLFANASGWSDVRFEFEANGGRMIYTNKRGTKKIPFGFGKQAGFNFPETHFPGNTFDVPGGKEYEAWASAGWVDHRTLSILCHLTDDHCGNLRLNAVFDGDRVTILLRKSAERFLMDYEGWVYGYSI